MLRSIYIAIFLDAVAATLTTSYLFSQLLTDFRNWGLSRLERRLTLLMKICGKIKHVIDKKYFDDLGNKFGVKRGDAQQDHSRLPGAIFDQRPVRTDP